jgi:hypothetical protein
MSLLEESSLFPMTLPEGIFSCNGNYRNSTKIELANSRPFGLSRR